MMTTDRDQEATLDELLDRLDATVFKLGRLFASRCCEEFNTTPITGYRLFVLRLLAELGESRTGNLAAHLGIKAPGMTALIDALVREGLVERSHDPEDRRVTLVRLSEAGLEILRHAEQQRRVYMKRHLGALSDEDIRTLIRIHGSIIDGMSNDSGALPASKGSLDG
jgi:DNA-binding MarR family transcriptional regulator